MILAPVVRGRKGEYKKDLEKFARQGFLRARIDGVAAIARRGDRARQAQEPHHRSGRGPPAGEAGLEKRLEASIETATKLAGGLVTVAVVNGEERLYSQKMACPDCGESVPRDRAALVLLQ